MVKNFLSRTLCVLQFVVLSFMLSGCSSVSYFSHLLNGQVSLLWDRESVADLLASEETSERLRARLVLSQELRTYAEDVLLLPVGEAYTSYTDVGRPFVVWNVYAAPELSLKAHTWCYPVLGCLAYRGYYEKDRAEREALDLELQGFETRVGGVRAYSTLGFFDDPLLSTFLLSDEVYFVELLIHEISHRKLYISDDTKFNENFATAVATLGAEQWYRAHKTEALYSAYQEAKLERQDLMAFVLAFKDHLSEVYENGSLSKEQKRQHKDILLSELRTEYQALKANRGWDGRYDKWIAQMNNASFATLSNYQELVPGFLALYRQVGGGWADFYAAVETLAELKKEARHQRLNDLAKQQLVE